jgi:hypothetical protein
LNRIQDGTSAKVNHGTVAANAVLRSKSARARASVAIAGGAKRARRSSSPADARPTTAVPCGQVVES